jgi:bifunctional DNA-binding transcriptional regulator/antitoxin component of YhaV-PrlF toxin-antitoxin module
MAKVGERGQITIDKSIRDQLCIRPSDIAVQEVVDGHLVVYFIPTPHRRSLYGILKPRPKKPIKNWRKAKEKAWGSRARERKQGMSESD